MTFTQMGLLIAGLLIGALVLEYVRRRVPCANCFPARRGES